MKITNENCDKIQYLYLFCQLYLAHRDFDLAKKIAKNKPLSWEQAEKLSNFCNQIILNKETKPQNFIVGENENADNAINKFLILKDCIQQIKIKLGAKGKNELYKSVKSFYRKKSYCYQMDSFYTHLIKGAFLYTNRIITFKEFTSYYCFEISLFTGIKSDIDLRYVIKMSNYILKC